MHFNGLTRLSKGFTGTFKQPNKAVKDANLYCDLGSRVAQEAADAMATESVSSVDNEVLWLGTVFELNAWATPGPGAAVFRTACKANHSCVPNVMKQRFKRDGEFVEFVVTALRDIHAGEELFIDYGVPQAPVETRRAYLQMKYKFICHCPACDNEREAPVQADPEQAKDDIVQRQWNWSKVLLSTSVVVLLVSYLWSNLRAN